MGSGSIGMSCNGYVRSVPVDLSPYEIKKLSNSDKVRLSMSFKDMSELVEFSKKYEEIDLWRFALREFYNESLRRRIKYEDNCPDVVQDICKELFDSLANFGLDFE